MSVLDWIVLGGTMGFIVIYGIWRSRNANNLDAYLLADQSMPWWMVTLSVMATQASAITFLSAPGQAYTQGMGFAQFYFGLPLAMIILCATAIPIYHRLKVYTAYQYLETRFDYKTRALAAFLFLVQRGLAAGFTIYAPAIVLSHIMGWNIYLTNLIVGGLVIVYTVTGGSKAVSYTQLWQMTIILFGMGLAGFMVVQLMPAEVGFTDALHVAGKMGRLEVVNFDFDLNNKYTIWSGLLGGLFLALSYFGTDQSQVARYLSGRSVAQSRMGLLVNGAVKIPMQFLILLIGALLFVFYQFEPPPLFFNDDVLASAKATVQGDSLRAMESEYLSLWEAKKNVVAGMASGEYADTAAANAMQGRMTLLRDSTSDMIGRALPLADNNDTNYIFLNFVTHYLPAGLIGLLLAVILSASMSSTSSELNALASTTVIDIYKRSIKRDASDYHYVNASRWATIGWGIYAIGVAMFANRLGTLIEAVNILGSLFYGTILGIFLAAFYFPRIKGTSVFIAALISETAVILMYFSLDIGFLWYNFIGCALTIMLGIIFSEIERTIPGRDVLDAK